LVEVGLTPEGRSAGLVPQFGRKLSFRSSKSAVLGSTRRWITV
jgi:hypothetical protein